MQLINPEVRIETTNLCNASCIICTHDIMTRPKGTMKTEFFKDLVKQAKEMGATMISPFGFGEPLIDKELEDKISFCRDLGLETFITTNGSLADIDRMIALFNAGLTHVRFSVHATNEANYMKVHRKLDWHTTKENLYYTKKIKDEVFPDRIVSLTVIPMHGETVNHVRNYWESMVDYLEIWRPHNWSMLKKYREKTSNHLLSCGRPAKGPIQVQWDGRLIPCCFLTDAEIVLGDAHKESLETILKGEAYNDLRARHEVHDFEGLPCEECDQRFILDESPLLYSSRDKDRHINTTSSMKFHLK